MVDLGFEPGRDEQGVMVGRFVAAVEPHEGPDRRSVREAHDVGRDEAERVHVPARAFLEVGRLDDEMAELGHLRRLERRPLRIVHPHDLIRRVMRDRGARGERLGRRIAVQRVDLDALRVAKAHHRAAARVVRPFDRASELLRQGREVIGARDREPKSDEPGLGAAGDAIDVRPRTGSPQEEFVLGFRDDEQPEIAKILLSLREIGPLEMNEQKSFALTMGDALRGSSTLPGLL